MNEQQLWSLIAVCAVVFIALGAVLGTVVRAVRTRVSRWLPPRHLRRAGERRRRGAGGAR